MMCLQFKFMRNGEVINVIIMTVVNIGFIAIPDRPPPAAPSTNNDDDDPSPLSLISHSSTFYTFTAGWPTTTQVQLLMMLHTIISLATTYLSRVQPVSHPGNENHSENSEKIGLLLEVYRICLNRSSLTRYSYVAKKERNKQRRQRGGGGGSGWMAADVDRMDISLSSLVVVYVVIFYLFFVRHHQRAASG